MNKYKHGTIANGEHIQVQNPTNGVRLDLIDKLRASFHDGGIIMLNYNQHDEPEVIIDDERIDFPTIHQLWLFVKRIHINERDRWIVSNVREDGYNVTTAVTVNSDLCTCGDHYPCYNYRMLCAYDQAMYYAYHHFRWPADASQQIKMSEGRRIQKQKSNNINNNDNNERRG